MPLLERIQKDLVSAMKAKDEAGLSAIRMIKTALKKVEVDSMKPLDEAAEMQVLNSLIKQRTESAEMFRTGGRVEMTEKEEAGLSGLWKFTSAEPYLAVIVEGFGLSRLLIIVSIISIRFRSLVRKATACFSVGSFLSKL